MGVVLFIPLQQLGYQRDNCTELYNITNEYKRGWNDLESAIFC